MGGVGDLLVVTGPPGAGKSTVARAVSGLFEPSALVAGDQFFAFIDRGYIPPWTAAAHRQNETVIRAAAAARMTPDAADEAVSQSGCGG